MAGPITHIVIAKEFLSRFPFSDERSFLLGVSFPDIRYLGLISRAETHPVGVDLRKVVDAPQAFVAGMNHHMLVDVVRERFVVERGIYAAAPSSPYVTQALKFFEDERLHGRHDDWNETVAVFEGVSDQEKEFPIQVADIARWHDLVREYVRVAPTAESRRQFILGIGLTGIIADEIERVIGLLRANVTVAAILDETYVDFTSKMSV